MLSRLSLGFLGLLGDSSDHRRFGPSLFPTTAVLNGTRASLWRERLERHEDTIPEGARDSHLET